MRIVAIATVDWFVEDHFLAWFRAVQARGADLTLLARRQRGEERVPIEHLEMSRSEGSLALVREARRLLAAPALRDAQAIVIFATRPFLAMFLATFLAPRRQWPPILVVFTGFGSGVESSSMIRHLFRFALRFMDRQAEVRFVVQNEGQREFLLGRCGLPEKIVSLIPSAGVTIHGSSFRNHDGPLKVLMGCRLLRDKGVLDYLRCAELLGPETGLRFHLAGSLDDEDGNPNALGLNQVREICDAVGVEYIGNVPDLNASMGNYDAFVHCSHHEGSPLVVAEAMSQGLPAFLSDIPGHELLLVPSHGELLSFPCGDSPELANRLQRWAQMKPKARKQLSEDSVAHIQATAEREAMADKFVALIPGLGHPEEATPMRGPLAEEPTPTTRERR